jgi:hypothetical protein
MSRRGFFAVPFVLMLVSILLIVGGLALHRIGWSEGYQMGLLADGTQSNMVLPYSIGMPGLALTLIVVLLAIMLVGKAFHLLAWTAACQSWAPGSGPAQTAHRPAWAHWARHHCHHPPAPPWCWEPTGPAGERTGHPDEQAKPDATGAGSQPAA